MPPLPGETLLFNIFADVHYYFNQPSVKPLHHRFDKGSYVYLYYNSTQRRARLEIANNAGTLDQDALNGYLDTAIMTNTFKHPTLFSVVLDGTRAGTTSPRPADHSQWHLPTFDPKNEQKYLYKIHSLDLYLWTTKDATLFLDAIKWMLSFQQLNLTEPAPPPEHESTMSPVVQQLEHIAINTPPHARAPSTASSRSHPGLVARTPESQASGSVQPATVPTPALAPYNPAAPSAPEPIAHREKTPPPLDAASGTGLSAAAVHESPAQFAAQAPQFNQASQQAMFPGPPQRSTSLQSFPPPPPPPAAQNPHQGLQTAPSFAGPPTASQGYASAQQQQPQTQYATYPQQQSAHYPQSPGFPMTTPLQSPGMPSTPSQPPGYPQHTPLQSPGLPPPPPMSAPVGGFSNYTYGSQSSQQQQVPQTEAYSIHGQTYRPTEAEAAHGHVPRAQTMRPGGLEERLKKTEKGVGRFLRRLDQKI